MRKSLVAALLLVCALVCLCGSCTSKTPDVVASESEAAITLDTVDWTLAVEGADKSSYSLADAEAHELSKITVSMVISVEDVNMASSRKSFIIEGIKLSEFLADVGKSDATKVTCYGTDLYGDETSIEVTGDLINSEEVLIGWIMNKKTVIPDTTTYVGIFAAGTVTEFDGCASISKIVIE